MNIFNIRSLTLNLNFTRYSANGAKNYIKTSDFAYRKVNHLI